MLEDSVWTNIFRKKEGEKEDILSVLKRIPLFQDLSKKELRQLERILHQRTYREGEVVFNEGDPGVGMYIIEEGEVRITLGRDQRVLAVLSKGDFFGEMALLLEAPRTASAIASKPSILYGFFQPDLFSILETYPRTGNKILLRLSQMIAERLRRSNIENRELREKLQSLSEKGK
ncbi:putative transcriptional regulator, Crp/Fnr family [Caldithrix abyssi DSM 13497]|uniref:Cyclic nucleotide-binding domain-containing protein n=1 Tax=Caldithrix abyssi DSM 13497 TaxID=880073 RepID=H1XVA8_CALAY|nr:cyclic nucleotide-binding domain-containing protein [Caldithrix abyssi]APF20932.1 Cyclic nucleotide-binding domain-containing protein [Caldithrix abyssi DSM 13497]EHO40614.1 putative transcriptional regulator, Crp/Fnr family [Caldithrix abyssi DSM 13497]